MTCDVLVVGAGPAGLATAVSAARHGARVLVVERHAGTTIFPRATGVSARTVEILRNWGISRAVRAGSVPVVAGRAAGRTLVVARPADVFYPAPREVLRVSPALWVCCPQDHIEPLLAEQVTRYGGEICFSAELTDLRLGPHAVHAAVRDRSTGAHSGVRARYVVGADGPRSTVRDALGIGLEHLGTLGEYAQVLFRAPAVDRVTGTRPHPFYALTHPEARGVLLPVGRGRWAYAVRRSPERGESAGGLTTTARWTELLATATGVPDIAPEIIAEQPFTMTAAVATAFQAGRAFLVGDAAHRMTPVAGIGMNTAVHDGHNLGWKLAWATRGLAGDALLASYAAERGPVGRRNALRSLAPGSTDPADGLPGDLGTVHRSTVIADADQPAAGYTDPTLLSAAPGERAPHRWISLDGRRRSTIDLFDGRLTLVTGPRNGGWRRAVARLAGTGLPIVALAVGQEIVDPDGDVAAVYRTGDSGAVLVRPDGYVAWRADSAALDPDTALAGAVATALGHVPAPSVHRLLAG